MRLLGRAHGAGLYAMALGRDDRPVVAERDAKSVSVEDTFEVDLTDRTRVRNELVRLAERCVQRLRAAGRSGRTVVIKVRNYDFSTLTRSETLRGPTDDPAVVREAVIRLLGLVDTTGGVRLLGVGVSGLADFTQEDLFAQLATEREAVEAAQLALGAAAGDEERGGAEPEEARPRRWHPGLDVVHDEYGAGWVQGSGVGRVTVRFEQPWSAPGRVRTFAVDDPALRPGEPLPLVGGAPMAGPVGGEAAPVMGGESGPSGISGRPISGGPESDDPESGPLESGRAEPGHQEPDCPEPDRAGASPDGEPVRGAASPGPSTISSSGGACRGS